MDEVKAKVRLDNAGDVWAVGEGYRDKKDIRSLETEMLVDTGAVMMMLPQDMVEALGLKTIRQAIVTYADERKEERLIAGIVKININGRFMDTNCIVGPPRSEPLIGQIILEELDLVVDCANKTLGPNPLSPYLPLLKLKRL